MRQGEQPIQDGVVEAAATIPAERIQPAGPDDGRLHTPAQAAPPIETVAMPVERDLAGDPPAVAPPVKKPSIPTKEDIAWNTYSALRQDWSRHLAAADRAGIHAIYVGGYEQLRARMETLAETLPLKTVHAGRSGTSSPNSTKEPESAVKSRIISRRSRTGWNIANRCWRPSRSNWANRSPVSPATAGGGRRSTGWPRPASV